MMSGRLGYVIYKITFDSRVAEHFQGFAKSWTALENARTEETGDIVVSLE